MILKKNVYRKWVIGSVALFSLALLGSAKLFSAEALPFSAVFHPALPVQAPAPRLVFEQTQSIKPTTSQALRNFEDSFTAYRVLATSA